jgi:LacI family transcriptional regulator
VQAHGHPDGLFCHCDELAIAAFRALRDLGLHIPTDVALIGCEGNEFMEYFDPPLSTVAMPVTDLCRAAWQLLLRRMEDPDAPAQAVILPYQLQARESSRWCVVAETK